MQGGLPPAGNENSGEDTMSYSDFGERSQGSQDTIWNPTGGTNNGFPEISQHLVPQVTSAYSDVPFALSPELYIQMNHSQNHDPLCYLSFDSGDLSKYDYDFVLERSVVANYT